MQSVRHVRHIWPMLGTIWNLRGRRPKSYKKMAFRKGQSVHQKVYVSLFENGPQRVPPFRICKHPTVWGNIASVVLVSSLLPSGCVSSRRHAFKCVSPRRFDMFSKFAQLKYASPMQNVINCVSPMRFGMVSKFVPLGDVSPRRRAFNCISPRRFGMFSKLDSLGYVSSRRNAFKCVSPRRFGMFSKFAPLNYVSSK